MDPHVSHRQLESTIITQVRLPLSRLQVQVLESYCNWLENRVVSVFDAAVAAGELGVQAQCVAIMIELDQERSIVQVGCVLGAAVTWHIHIQSSTSSP